MDSNWLDATAEAKCKLIESTLLEIASTQALIQENLPPPTADATALRQLISERKRARSTGAKAEANDISKRIQK